MPELEWDGIWKRLREHVEAREQWDSKIVEAFRERMFEHLRDVIGILSDVEPDLSHEERLERFAIAILSMFDGSPNWNIGYTVAPTKDGIVGPNLTGGLDDAFMAFLAAKKNSVAV